MTFSPAFLDEIRGGVTLSELVYRRVKLAGNRREFKGLCPFHNEKSPSFTVSDDKGFYWCFGCGAHGDAIGWMMRAERLSFPEAVERLAEQAGLPMPKRGLSDDEQRAEARRASLLEALEAACLFFEKTLAGASGTAARAYLFDQRGISTETAARFRLGLAPDGWDGLRQALDARRFPDDLLIEAGLRRKSEKGSRFDTFRGRLMIPIGDVRGRVVGFGARALKDGDEPKYLNSPAGPVFDKSAILFGWALARAGMMRKDDPPAAAEATTPRVTLNQLISSVNAIGPRPVRVPIVVEGYLDAITMHQAGLDTAVAPLGTALTAAQLGLLWKLHPQPILCLDGDEPGQKAMERAVDRALDLADSVRGLRFARLAGKDPDEMIRGGQMLKLRSAIARAQPLSIAAFEMIAARHEQHGPDRDAALEHDLLAAGSRIGDTVLRRHVLGEFRRRLREDGAGSPRIFLSRSTRRPAPPPASDWLDNDFQFTRDTARRHDADLWLKKQGIDVSALEARIGGIGVARARIVNGRAADGHAWVGASRPALWDHAPDSAASVSLVVVPAWEGAPGASAIIDLVGWDPRENIFAMRTGAAIVLGQWAVDTAIGFEARGLARPVLVAETPLSWMRRTAAGEDCILIVDAGRIWDVLGGIRAVVAETVEHGEALEALLRPPSLRRPRIMVEDSEAIPPIVVKAAE